MFNRTHSEKKKKKLFSSFANFRSDDVKNSRVEGKLWLFGSRTMFSTRRNAEACERASESRNNAPTWRSAARLSKHIDVGSRGAMFSTTTRRLHFSSLFLCLCFSDDVIGKNQLWNRVKEKNVLCLDVRNIGRVFSSHELTRNWNSTRHDSWQRIIFKECIFLFFCHRMKNHFPSFCFSERKYFHDKSWAVKETAENFSDFSRGNLKPNVVTQPGELAFVQRFVPLITHNSQARFIKASCVQSRPVIT